MQTVPLQTIVTLSSPTPPPPFTSPVAATSTRPMIQREKSQERMFVKKYQSFSIIILLCKCILLFDLIFFFCFNARSQIYVHNKCGPMLTRSKTHTHTPITKTTTHEQINNKEFKKKKREQTRRKLNSPDMQ